MSTLVRWYGQSAFLLEGERSVFVDPFGDFKSPDFRYPPRLKQRRRSLSASRRR